MKNSKYQDFSSKSNSIGENYYDQHHESPPAVIPLTILNGDHISANATSDMEELYQVEDLKAHVKTTLMESHVPGSPADVHKQAAPVYTSDGQELLFCIGTDDKLSYISSAKGAHRGWTNQLVEGFGDGAIFTAVAASITQDQKICVAIAVSNKDGSNNTLHTTMDFNLSNPDKTEWKSYGRIANAVVRELIFWQMDNGVPPELIVRSGSSLVWIKSNGKPPVVIFSSLPADVHNITVGWMGSKKERYPAVGWLRKSTGLYSYDSLYGRRFTIGDFGITALASASSWQNPNRYYFAMKDQVYIVDRAGVRRRGFRGKIPGSNNIDELMVRFVNGREEVFVLSGNKVWMSHLTGWRCLANDVQKIASSEKLKDSKANFHCFVSNDSHVASISRDNRTTLIKRTEVILPNDTSTQHVMTGTTRVRVVDKTGTPLHNHPFTLELGESCYLQVNRDCFFGVQDKTYKFKTNGNGEITIVKHLYHLSMPKLRLRFDQIEEVLDINPMAHLGQALINESKKDLANLKIGEGSRARDLLAPQYKGRADVLKKSLEKFGDHIQKLNAKKSFNSDAARAEGVSLSLYNEPLIAELPEWAFGRESWGFRIEGENAVFMEHAEAEAFWASERIEGLKLFSDLGTFLEHVIQQGLKFSNMVLRTVGNELHVFFDNLGRIIVKTLEGLMDLIKVSLKAVFGIDLDAIVQWLGFFFNWDYIKGVHKRFVEEADHQIEWIKGKLNNIDNAVDHYMNGLEAKVRKLDADGLPNKIKDLNHHDLGKNALEHGGMGAHREDVDAFSNRTLTHPGANWANMAFSNHQDVHLDENFVLPNIAATEETNELVRQLTELGQPIIDYFQEHHLDLFEKVSSNTLSMADIFQEIVNYLLETGIEALKGIVHLIIETLKSNFDKIIGFLKTKIEIPFFEAIWKNVLGIEVEFNLLNLLMLFLAIPGAIIYKIASPKAQFVNVSEMSEKHWKTWVAVWLGGVGATVLQTLNSLLIRASGLIITPIGIFITCIVNTICLIARLPRFLVNNPDISMLWVIWITQTILSGFNSFLSFMFLNPVLNLFVRLASLLINGIEEIILLVQRLLRGVKDFALVDAIIRPVQALTNGCRSIMLPIAIIFVETIPVAVTAVSIFQLTNLLSIACDVTRSTLSVIGYFNPAYLQQTEPLKLGVN